MFIDVDGEIVRFSAGGLVLETQEVMREDKGGVVFYFVGKATTAVKPLCKPQATISLTSRRSRLEYWRGRIGRR